MCDQLEGFMEATSPLLVIPGLGLELLLLPVLFIVGIFILVKVKQMIVMIDQANVGVVTRFGRYHRVLQPGFNVITPFFNKLHSTVAVQNQTAQLKFAAITKDQAAVHFTATIIYTVTDHAEETIKQVAFKFVDANSLRVALNSAVEASVREFVATKRQAEVLGLRNEITGHAQLSLKEQLAGWGYTLVDLTVNDITFDQEVMASMSRVVAAKNAQTAAEFEGEALLIARTKQAEADAAAIKIAAESEAEAARLRGRGLAEFRRELSEGLAESAQVLEAGALDPSFLLFSMWTETMRDVAKDSDGNVLFFDGGIESMQDSLQRMQGMMMVQDGASKSSPAAKNKSIKSGFSAPEPTVQPQQPATPQQPDQPAPQQPPQNPGQALQAHAQQMQVPTSMAEAKEMAKDALGNAAQEWLQNRGR